MESKLFCWILFWLQNYPAKQTFEQKLHIFLSSNKQRTTGFVFIGAVPVPS